MTVSELLDHFGFYPDSIVYYDRNTNVQDVVYIKRSEQYYDDEQYDEFLNEYGNRFVSYWHMDCEYDLHIDIG